MKCGTCLCKCQTPLCQVPEKPKCLLNKIMQFILFSWKQPRLDRFVGRSQGSEAVTLAGSGGPYGSLIFKVQKASGVKTHCWATISRFKWEVEYTCWIFQQAKFDCQRYVQATNDLKSRQTSGSIPVIPMTTSISVIISSGFIRFGSSVLQHVHLALD